jgi:YbbR domain-containing protein
VKFRAIDVPLMIASLALSLFLWVVVQVQLGAKTEILHVPLNLINRPDKMSADGYPHTVDVETVATSEQSDWLDSHKTELYATVDLKGIGPGTHWLPVVFHHPSTDMAFVTKSRNVPVQIDTFVTVPLPVSVTLKGDPPAGMAWVSQTVMPKKVDVSGPAQLVAQAFARVEIDRTHYQENGQIQASIKVVDKSGEVLDGLTAEPNTVTVTPLVEPVKTVSIDRLRFKGMPATGYHVGILEFNAVQIRGPKKILDSMNSIQLPVVDLTGLSESFRVSLLPNLPPSVALLNGKTIEILIPIEPDPVAPIPTPTNSRNVRPDPASRGNTLP